MHIHKEIRYCLQISEFAKTKLTIQCSITLHVVVKY